MRGCATTISAIPILLLPLLLVVPETVECFASQRVLQVLKTRNQQIVLRPTKRPPSSNEESTQQQQPGATKQQRDGVVRLYTERVWKNSNDDPVNSDPNCEDDAEHVEECNSFVHDGEGEAIRRLGGSSGCSSGTVWTEFSRLAAENDVVNLGQGFPDWTPPQFAIDSLVEAATNVGSSPHQYTRPAGHPRLVKQLARRYSAHLRHDVEPFSQVAVTVGASQALYLTLQTLIQPGDEVIVFEPFFDLYVNQIKLAGGTPVFCPLRFEPYDNVDGDDDACAGNSGGGGTWVLDSDALMKGVVNTRTKAILLNSPHNPTGKIFTRSEMEYVAEALEMANPDCVVVSDEVYKYIVHAPPAERAPEESLFCRGHVHFASLPGMWERTITISSAGKTFSATGWQVGWCVGPQRLISRIHQLIPYVQFCASTVMQEALAGALTRADEPYEGFNSYYDYLRDMYTRKRDKLASALTEAGFDVPDHDVTPGGGFFLFARAKRDVLDMIPTDRLYAPNPAAPTGESRSDWALCQWMAEEKGFLCLPSSPFFSPQRVERGVSDRFVRIAFCKTDETIHAAATALRALKRDQQQHQRGGEVVQQQQQAPDQDVALSPGVSSIYNQTATSG